MNPSSSISKQKPFKKKTEGLNWAFNVLKDYNLALKLLSISIGKSTAYTISHLDEKFKENEEKKFIKIVKKIKKNVPLAYILKEEEFYGLKLNIDENVFIPRPETEILVQEILKLKLPRNSKILDIGTGSGAIALALKKEKRFLKVFANDISFPSLIKAKENSKKLNLKVLYFCDDLTKALKGKFDLIVSNPPYIPSKDLKKLPENVKKEPKIALNGGREGLKVIYKILKFSKEHLKKNGYLALEIGENQCIKVLNFSKKLGYNIEKIVKDLSNIERVVILKWSL